MRDLSKFQTIFTKFSKTKHRPILSLGHVDDSGNLFMTDLETSVQVKNTGLKAGMHDLSKISLIDKTVDNMSVDDFPQLPFETSKNTFTLSVLELSDFFNYISKDETRLYFNGICFIGKQAVATNGHVLKVTELETENKLESSILPRESLKYALDIAKKLKQKEIVFQVSSDYFTVDFGDILLSGRIIARDYPKFQAVIPSKTSLQFKLEMLPKFSEIKTVLNSKSYAVRLESCEGRMLLKIPGHDLAYEIGTVDENQAPIVIGYNFKYLELFGQGVTVKLNNELNPTISEQGETKKIVMPLKL